MTSTIDFVEKRRRGFGSRGVYSRQLLVERSFLPHLGHYKLKGHSGCVNTCRWKCDGNMIASGSDDTKVLLYKRGCNHKFQCIHEIETGHSANIFSVDFLFNEEEIVTGAMDGRVLINNFSTRVHRQQLYQYTGSCFKVEKQRDNKNTIISSGFGGVNLHDIRSRDVLNVVNMSGDQDEMWGEPYGLKLNPAISHLFTIAGGFPYVLTFDIRMPPPSHRVTSLRDAVHSIRLGPQCAATCVDISSDGNEILCAGNSDCEAKNMIFSLSQHGDTSSITHPIAQYSGHRNQMTVKEARFFGPWIVSGSDCGHFFIWNRDGKLLLRKRADYATVNVVAPHPSLPLLVTSGIESNVKVWDVGNENDDDDDDNDEAFTAENHQYALLSFLLHQHIAREDSDDDDDDDDDDDFDHPRERWLLKN